MCLASLLTVYWWRKMEYPDKINDLSQVTEKKYSRRISLFYKQQTRMYFVDKKVAQTTLEHCFILITRGSK
jgi:hypothetical protein